MRSSRLAILIGLVTVVAGCVEGNETLTEPSSALLAKPAKGPRDPAATWYLPLDDAHLALRSDGQFANDGHSVYADGVCGLGAKIFATTEASNSGDATINSGVGGGGKKGCVRMFTLAYPDGYTETIRSFNNLRRLQNTGDYLIPLGETIRRMLVINPTALNNNPSRCDRVIFGQNKRGDGTIGGFGSDSVLVTRTSARTWHVRSESAELSKAACEKTGEVFAIPVDFIIEASYDLPTE